MAKNLCDTSPQGRMGSAPIGPSGARAHQQQDGQEPDSRSPDAGMGGGAYNVPLNSAGSAANTRQNFKPSKGTKSWDKKGRW